MRMNVNAPMLAQELNAAILGNKVIAWNRAEGHTRLANQPGEEERGLREVRSPASRVESILKELFG